MSEPIESINKEIDIIKRNQVENLELKITVAKMKNSPERGSTAVLSRQKRLANFNVVQLKLLTQRKRK